MIMFHTKTIETILDPLAKQISELVILNDGATERLDKLNLSIPINEVCSAVDNLVKVGRETANDCKYNILRSKFLTSLKRIEDAFGLLKLSETTSNMLEVQQFIADGSRGILQGTWSVLLALDEMDVRIMIQSCHKLLIYVRMCPEVKSVQDLETYVNNISRLLKHTIDCLIGRPAELISSVHSKMLQQCIENIQTFTLSLVSIVKIYVILLSQSNCEGTNILNSVADRRDCAMSRLIGEIKETIRVLQLDYKSDEDLGFTERSLSIRRAVAFIDSHMGDASDWLRNPELLSDAPGYLALSEIISEAKEASMHDGVEKDAILNVVSDLDSSVQAILQLREQGHGNSSQTLLLSRNAQDKLQELMLLLPIAAENVDRLERRVGGRLSDKMLVDFKDAKGEDCFVMAVAKLMEDSEKIALLLPPEHTLTAEIQSTIDNTHNLMTSYKDFVEKRDSAGVASLRNSILESARILRNLFDSGLVTLIDIFFCDPLSALKKLIAVANAPEGTPNRDILYAEKEKQFVISSDRLAESARILGAIAENVEEGRKIKQSSNMLRTFAKDVSAFSCAYMRNKSMGEVKVQFKGSCDAFKGEVERLRRLVDGVVDRVAFLRITEDSIGNSIRCADDAIARKNAPELVECISDITRRGNRVAQIVNHELEHNKDSITQFTLSQECDVLKEGITGSIAVTKLLSGDIRKAELIDDCRRQNCKILSSVGRVRQIFEKQSVEDNKRLKSTLNQELQEKFSNIQLSEKSLRPSISGVSDEDLDASFPDPRPSRPIMIAAQEVHSEVRQWSSRDNDLIAVAKRMAFLMAKFSDLVSGECGSMRELIETAKALVVESNKVRPLAKKLAAECTDRRMVDALIQVSDSLPAIGTQLNVLSTVKATMLGRQGTEEDLEATEMLEGNASNLMRVVLETVKAAKSACVRIRVDSGYVMRWTPRITSAY